MPSYTDDELKAFISNTPDLKDTTKAPYLANLNTISRCVGGTPLHTVLNDAAKWFPVIKSRTKTTGTLRTLVKTLLALCKYAGIKDSQPMSLCHKAWYTIFLDLSQELQVRADNNVATAATELTWTQILQKRNKLKLGTIEHVTLALYTYIPPRRQQDYWKLALNESITDKTGYMNLDAKEPTMTITAFKTNDKYPAYTIKMPTLLVNAIRAYLKSEKAEEQEKAEAANEQNTRQYLFCKKAGGPYATLSSFTDANNTVIKRALEYKAASVNSLRHAGASHVALDPTILYGEKKAYAQAMGHSLAMQGKYVVARPRTPPM